MTERRFILAGAILSGLAVAAGAFGAHAVKPFPDMEASGWWQLAVQYQMWHGLAVLGLGLSGWNGVRLPAWLFTAGAIVFAGTLYAMALGAPRWLGAVTPLGGLLLLAGWVTIVLRTLKADSLR